MAHAKRVLILGGGFGGVYAYRALRRQRRWFGGDFTMHMVSNQNYFLFVPMLHEVATGGLNRSDIVEPLRTLIDTKDEFIRATVEGVDFEKKLVRTGAGELSYDALVVSLGASTNFYGVQGAAEYALPLKNLEDASRVRNRALSCMELAAHDDKQNAARLLTWTIVGGGATGVELAAELVDYAHSYAGMIPAFPLELLRVELFQADAELLPMFSPRVRRIATRVLERKNVKIHCGAKVIGVREEELLTSQGTIPVGFTVWTAGVGALPLEYTPADVVEKDNRFRVTPALNLERFPEVFVIGDQARIDGVPQTAQAAVAEAHHAARNIAATFKKQITRPFVFRKKGDLISLGQWSAVGDIYGVPTRGAIAWWIWRTVYLFKLIGLPNRIRVAIDWTINLFYARDLTEL